MASQPVDQISDNIVGDITDAMMTGLFSHILVKVLMGKNPSIQSILNMETLKQGATAGAGIALYRRVGRPVINNMMEKSGMGNSITL